MECQHNHSVEYGKSFLRQYCNNKHNSKCNSKIYNFRGCTHIGHCEYSIKMSGIPGTIGVTGTSCAPGIPGAPGAQGAPGFPGTFGDQGPLGITGPNGTYRFNRIDGSDGT